MENELSILVSWLISFLGIGVTALLGINILTSLSINKRIKTIVAREIKELKKQNEKLKEQLKYYSLAMDEKSKGDEYSRMGATTDAFFNYINSLHDSFKAEDKDLISSNLDDCLRIIKINPSFVIDDETTKRNINPIKNILLEVQDERSYELYSYFVSLSSDDSSQPHLESQQTEQNESDSKR